MLTSRLERLAAFIITISGPADLYPSPSRPRALVLRVVRGSEQLNRVRDLLISALADKGVRVEDRFLHCFRPHVTLARVKVKIYGFTAKMIVNEVSRHLRGLSINVLVDRVELLDSSRGLYKTIYVHKLSC